MSLSFSGDTQTIAEYDLSHRVPTLARVAPFTTNANLSPYAFAFDSQNHRAFNIVTFGPGAPDIQAFDLRTLSFVGKRWSVQTKLPGFDPMGLAYSARDQRVYVAGLFTGGIGLGPGTYSQPVPALPTAIAAFDTNGNLEWWKLIPQCQMLGGVFGWGGPIFASSRLSALYIFCVRASNDGVEAEYPGESGLVRLWVTPNGVQSDAGSFRLEFFPVAGHYVSGAGVSVIAAFDPVTERLFVANQSTTTPGMWAFDGSISAWVGFVGTDGSHNYGLGVDPTTGHVFLKSGDDASTGILVTAGRSTPVPQGREFHQPLVDQQSLWLVDSATHKVFMRMDNGSVAVLEDHTTAFPNPTSVDYDSLTVDVPESANTVSTFAGDAGGFAARALIVGGYGGVIDPVVQTAGTTNSDAVGGFSPGDRSITLASVPSVDFRDTGAAASAQSVAPDSLTQNDYSTKQTALAAQGNAAHQGTGDQVAGFLNWQWPAAACLDAGGQKMEDTSPGPGGSSDVVCDLDKEVDAASTSVTGFSMSGLTLGSASFQATSQRDQKLGTTTAATAVTRNIELAIDGGGTLFIQRVEATATTIAHGRTGTAKSAWSPLIEGVVLRDAKGNVLFSCDQCDPQQVAAQVNGSALATKVRILIPTALLQATPHGAYASVGKNETDYWSGLTLNDDNSHAIPAMQIELYNDYGQKSRLVVQLAAIQASSIYGISILPEYQPPPSLGGSVGSIIPPIAHGSTGASTNVDGKYLGGGVSGSALRRFTLGVGLLFRSPKDSLLFALVCLLFGGAAVLVRRRQLLASSLEESSR